MKNVNWLFLKESSFAFAQNTEIRLLIEISEKFYPTKTENEIFHFATESSE